MGMRREKQLKGMEPATAIIIYYSAQSIKSEYQVFWAKGEEGSRAWGEVSLKEGL